MQNKRITLLESILPFFCLILLLAINYQIFGSDASSGANQFGLILGASVAMIIAAFKRIPFKYIMECISQNIKDIVPAILILLLVGALAGTWMLSGIVPTMIYYGLNILSPSIFLVASVIISAIVATATGSSWTTTATIGIALVGIGNSLGFDASITAGAVISGAYFGDKMSPMSDTTNLAPAMAGTDLITHIRYMTITTLPSIIITIIIFLIMGLTMDSKGVANPNEILNAISNHFTVTPWLIVVPIIVILMIIRKAPPLIALLAGALLGAIAAAIFQQDLILEYTNKLNNTTGDSVTLNNIYHVSIQSIIGSFKVLTGNPVLDKNELFSSGGMAGMLSTIELIICAMIFGGSMQAIGALQKLSNALLSFIKGTTSLVATTVASCLGMNILASDQYLAIVVPGKMFAKAYKDRKLAPENLSRTLEDSGTVTSVLIPWNTCGAYQSQVLAVDVFAYLPYAFFNIISPIMTITIAAIGYKINKLKTDK